MPQYTRIRDTPFEPLSIAWSKTHSNKLNPKKIQIKKRFSLQYFKLILILNYKRGSLDKIIAKREMTPDGKSKLFNDEDLYLWSNDILSALVYIRQKNIVHRDVKPQ